MCVILYANIDDMKILAKNRDRTYKPIIEIIHEIVNGVEIAYIKDKKTGWIEGINEDGVGIVNATLNMKESEHIRKTRKMANQVKKNNIYNALSEKTKNHFFSKLMENNKNNLLEGNSLLIFDNKVYHTENNLQNKFYIKNVKHNEVYSNHGMIMKKEGYTKGKKGLSSFLRKKITETELQKIKDENIGKDKLYDTISTLLNKNYINIDPRFHPYRDKNMTLKRVKDISENSTFVNTTGQLILNTTNKELVYYTDIHNSKHVKYINKLPSDYSAKIRVIIKETEKNTKPYTIFTQKYLRNVYKQFDYIKKPNKTRTLNRTRKPNRTTNKTHKKREKI
jgi:hypothetical protein